MVTNFTFSCYLSATQVIKTLMDCDVASHKRKLEHHHPPIKQRGILEAVAEPGSNLL